MLSVSLDIHMFPTFHVQTEKFWIKYSQMKLSLLNSSEFVDRKRRRVAPSSAPSAFLFLLIPVWGRLIRIDQDWSGLISSLLCSSRRVRFISAPASPRSRPSSSGRARPLGGAPSSGRRRNNPTPEGSGPEAKTHFQQKPTESFIFLSSCN